jgi:hypothetical protein
MCSGHSFVMVGRAAEERFTDLETGLQGQFRHQYFLVFLIAHFQQAGLLMLSDRLVVALSRLDIQKVETVKEFKRSIRQQGDLPALVTATGSRDIRPGAAA